MSWCVVVIVDCVLPPGWKKSSIYLSHRCGHRAELRALTLNSSMNRLAMRGLMGNPWQHHRPVHNTYLGRRSKCFWGKTQGVWLFFVQTCWSFVWGVGPVVILLDNIDWRVHGNRGEDSLDIIWVHDLTWFQLYLLDVLYEVLSVFLRWCGDGPTSGQMMLASSLATPYVMDPLLELKGLRGCLLYVLWECHKILGQLHWWGTLFCNCSHYVFLGF